jgi:hypothetical protein
MSLFMTHHWSLLLRDAGCTPLLSAAAQQIMSPNFVFIHKDKPKENV